MKALHFYRFATLVLLLLNISVIAYFLFSKPKPPHHPKHGGTIQQKVIKLLQLDENQQTTFLQLAENHNQSMTQIDNQQSKLLESYFRNLTDTTPLPSNTDSLLLEVQQLERSKITTTYQHFEDVKAILSTDQQSNFEPFMNTILEKILLQRKKNPPPPKDF